MGPEDERALAESKVLVNLRSLIFGFKKKR
jgi:hypothetical protein